MTERYAVYSIIGRKVKFPSPKRKTSIVQGLLTDVRRDIFDNTIIFTVGTREFPFREPDRIRRIGNDLLLEYGDFRRVKTAEKQDEEMWAEVEAKQYKASTSETMHNMDGKVRKTIVIETEVPEPKKRTRRRRRVKRNE
jgi:hypothetical protein